MLSRPSSAERKWLTGILGLCLLFSPAGSALAAETPEKVPVGHLLSAEAARLLIRSEPARCAATENGQSPIILLTLGTESTPEGELHFHPLATFVFDRSLSDEENGQWIAVWVYGSSGPGWWRTVRAFLPFPAGTPSASEQTVEKLNARLEGIRSNPEEADLLVPDPVVHLANLDTIPRGETVWGLLRRGLNWGDVFNPAQFLYRSYLLRRKDRGDREFKRAYLAVQWLLAAEYDGAEEAAWLDATKDLRFRLLRSRSFFARWLEHADSVELVFNYESSVRQKLAKSSAWLQSAANEHLLRYEPFYRSAGNGTRVPVGGVLYYDPRLKAQPDPGWWKVANPFDLPYNPHTHAEVQRLARERPDELIPLAVYTFETNLALRPIIAIDFFAEGNPKGRERNQQLMSLAKEWLGITTGAFDLERLPYRLTAYAANKKSFTPLVDKSSSKGVEELRLALEANLYFDPIVAPSLQELADKRVLNPLVKAIPEQERLAHVQYESLRAANDRALCQSVEKIRNKMADRLDVPPGGDPETHGAELKRRLAAWQHEVRLADFVSQPLEDFGSLASLTAPLNYFLQADPVDAKRFEKILGKLYTKLYHQQLRLPPGHEVPELSATLDLTRQVWAHTLGDQEESTRHLTAVEARAASRYEKERAEQQKSRREALRAFLNKAREEIEKADKAGCDSQKAYASNLESHLAVLAQVLNAALSDKALQAEVDRRRPELHRELAQLDSTLSQCSIETEEAWRAQTHQVSLQLVRSLEQMLAPTTAVAIAGGR
jgi:hypothetical protein